jgi:hypothetical protein
MKIGIHSLFVLSSADFIDSMNSERFSLSVYFSNRFGLGYAITIQVGLNTIFKTAYFTTINRANNTNNH